MRKLAFHPISSNTDLELGFRSLSVLDEISLLSARVWCPELTLFWGVAGLCGLIYWV